MTQTARKIVWVVLLFAAVVFAGDVNQLYREGNRAYRNKDYATAIEKYLEAVKAGGVSPALYYNLGNAYFRAGSLACAILWYERARLLDPLDPDIRHNLEFARRLTQDKIESIYRGIFFRWAVKFVESLSFGLLWWLMVVISSLATLATVYYIFQLRGKWLAVVFWLVFLMVVGVWYVKGSRIWERNLAIVIVPKLDARSEPVEDSEIVFTVHSGTRVGIKEHRGNWYRILLENGSSGWVPDSTVVPAIPQNREQLLGCGCASVGSGLSSPSVSDTTGTKTGLKTLKSAQ